MLDDKKDDIFLSRWINGELSEKELNEFRSHPEYTHYKKIITGVDALHPKQYDIEKELADLKSKRNFKKSSSTIKLWPFVAAAASIVIIFGLFLFTPDISYHTNYGETLTVTLPDGSEMTLNAKSTASFDESNWDTQRNITLEGEAFFKVQKGSKFTVTTANGEVSVLGTQFSVHSQKSLFQVHCFEGKVSVASHKEHTILSAGIAFRRLDKNSEKWKFSTSIPSWLTNTSSFKNIPIQYVFAELEEQYNIIIVDDNVKLNKHTFTGTFPNNNLQVALRTVCNTLGIEYTISQDRKTVVLKK
ncbi:FecR family protein [Aquimarina sp. U1-2]|uniref:FecR family protein n=1 Tax=Aquimarina sp. U1-2 TaxID=2823141 RepID=UPI001AECB5A4|nr:FecR domain-containing protein [Aquimarina sp. U1-2]MBP2832340.1 FecR family protein [Aquimarina sp. U1-2]